MENILYQQIVGKSAENLVTHLSPIGKAGLDGKTITLLEKNDGVETNRFFANSNMVKISLDVTATVPGVCVIVGIVTRDDTVTLYKVIDGAKPGHLETSFDAANYMVYANAKEFFVQVTSLYEAGSMTLEDFSVCALEGLEQSSFYAPTLPEMLKNAFDRMDALQSQAVAKAPVVVSPSGKKFTLSCDDEGKLFTIPHVPNKAVFLGNSLVFGHGFYGMCASSSKADYFYHVTAAIKEKNPNATFTKVYSSPFEHSETLEDFEAWWSEDNKGIITKDVFTEDVDLIVIQIGDNVNNPTKVDAFSRHLPLMVKRVRAACPKARIIWVLGWFNRDNAYGVISETCAKWNIPLVDVSDLNIKENQAQSGMPHEMEDGSYEPVKDGWITHPGDKGMAAIAKRILEKIDM